MTKRTQLSGEKIKYTEQDVPLEVQIKILADSISSFAKYSTDPRYKRNEMLEQVLGFSEQLAELVKKLKKSIKTA
jgi:hypothetical protein